MWPRTGYNANFLGWGMPFPNNLSPSRGDPELSFDEFCANLAAAGTDCLRVNLCGLNNPLQTGALSFEPTLGVWNHWDGRLDEMVAAMRKYGIWIEALPFYNREFLDGWILHAWNTRNGGFTADPRDAFKTDRAMRAAQARIDAIVDLCGDVVRSWTLCSEMSWLVTPQFWDVPTWAAMQPVVREILVPWVDNLAAYIQSRHDGTVGNGNLHAPNGFADDPNHPSRLRNEIFTTPHLDFATTNWYGTNLPEKLAWLRACQAYTVSTPVYIEQYAPWAIGSNWPPEEPPFLASRRHEWAAACGEYGCVGPSRWLEIRGDITQWWGTAHPNMAKIAGTTHAFGRAVDLEGWLGRGQSWDGRISSENLALVSSWGNGEHLTAFLNWLDIGAHHVTIGGLLDGAYTARYFDWIEGDEVAERDAWCEDGQVVLETVPVRETAAALYLAPKTVTPPPLETRTMHVVLTEKRGDKVLSVWEGELAERVL